MSIQPTELPAPCYTCTESPISWVPGVPTDGLCYGCRNEVQANREDARDEVSVYHSGHGINHGTYRADVAL